MGIIKTDAEFHAATNQTKLDDAWWAVVGPDAGKAILTNGIDRLGPDWQPVPGVHTTPAQELGALPQNFANLLAAINALSAKIDNIPANVWNATIGNGNAAGILANIDAKPAAVTNVAAQAAAPVPVDVEALAASIAAKLNATQADAVIAAIRAQYNK